MGLVLIADQGWWADGACVDRTGLLRLGRVVMVRTTELEG